MSVRLRPVLLAVWVLLGASLSAQAYGPDLKAENLNALDQHLKAAGSTYKSEPLLASYLAYGQNEDFVAALLKRGCNPNLKAPGSALSPLSLAIVRNLGPGVVSLLLQGGAALESRISGYPGNTIDVALDKQEWENANLLIKANQRNLPKGRLVPSDRFKDYPAFFLDDLVQVRNILRYGELSNTLVWNLALAGNSKKVLKYLIEFQIDPHLNDPGRPQENGVGLDLLATRTDLLESLLSDGLSRDQVNFDGLYLRLFTRKALDSVQALKAIDPVARPSVFVPALAAGWEFLGSVTNNLADVSPADFLGLYRHALAHKDVVLVRNLVTADPQRVRPELYAEALDAGFDLFLLLTRNLTDLKDPALFQTGAANNGQGNLMAVLWRSGPGTRTLLERIFEKTDFPTVLSLIQPMNPPREILEGQTFSADYHRWMDRGNKDVLSFGFRSPGAEGIIQGTEIAVAVPSGTDLTALVAEFRLSGGQTRVGSVLQVSGQTVNDFSAPVVLEVTAQDGSQKTYTVRVTLSPGP